MILLDGVSKTYPGDKVPALDNVSLHVSPNEFVFIVGKSGAGKSTLTKMITKEERQDSGKIIVGGIDLDYIKTRHIPHYRRRLGVVFQDFKLLPRRTVYENVAFALEIAGMSNKEIRSTVPKVLELVGLLDQAKKFPSQLSGGQKQRVSIARSVARQPKILIADEPTANLDHLTTKEIIDLLKKINDFGTTLLVTTHNESIVNHLQKRVITMENGRIISDQKTNGLYRLDSASKIQKPGERLAQPHPRIIHTEMTFKKPGETPLAPHTKSPAIKIQKPGEKLHPATKLKTQPKRKVI
ncbi:ATP-binding cassette domain-containing protein [Candidatus Saccharibacteria bacterium]|nr:ATP-binding cassette domain-containing protein [Candidatus Saccharibacteria bacterium]